MSTPTAPPAAPLSQPAGLYPLFFTELWERFSYYGMRALLTLFMVAPVVAGGLGYDVKRAAMIYGTYTMTVYMLSIPGGFFADNFIGKGYFLNVLAKLEVLICESALFNSVPYEVAHVVGVYRFDDIVESSFFQGLYAGIH